MRLYLIRHAQSENNAKPEHLRREDPPISALGKLQAEHLAKWAGTLQIGALITSPFLRTLQTVRSITDHTRQHVHVWHDLFEQGGCYRGHGPSATEGGPGLGRSAIQHQLCEDGVNCTIDDSISEQGWWSGRCRETDEQAAERASDVVGRFLETFGDSRENVVVVIHADFKRLLLAEMLRPSINPDDLGPLRNTSITKLEHNGSRWTLDWFNSLSHLPTNLVSQGETDHVD